MSLTLDAARAVVRHPGLHLSDIVNEAIRVMKSLGDWNDWQEADALERVTAREGRPVRHDEAHDFNCNSGRFCDLGSTPQTRRLALSFMAVTAGIALFLTYTLIDFAVAKADARPAACAGLTGAECSARAEAGW